MRCYTVSSQSELLELEYFDATPALSCNRDWSNPVELCSVAGTTVVALVSMMATLPRTRLKMGGRLEVL